MARLTTAAVVDSERLRRQVIDAVLGDKPADQREHFAMRLEGAFDNYTSTYLPARDANRNQREFFDALGKAIHQLAVVVSGAHPLQLEMLGHHLSNRAGTYSRELAGYKIASLRKVVAEAAMLSSACRKLARTRAAIHSAEDELIREIAMGFAASFQQRPSASRSGQFSKLLLALQIYGKPRRDERKGHVGSDRLSKLIAGVRFNLPALRKGRKYARR